MSQDPRRRWQEQAETEVRRALAEEPTTNVAYRPVYFPEDVAVDASIPGAFPYSRGVWASMYLGKPWTVRQYAGFSTAEESNRFYKSCLAEGQKGLSVAFDLPTHRGYDSDHPRARGDVGKAGVAIDSVEDMSLLFDGIPLDQVSVSMTMNGAVLPILASYVVAAEEQGVLRGALRGTIQNDILKEFLVRNTYIYPPQPSMRIVADVIGYASEEMPSFNPISISGYHLQEAGASEALELAYTLANGLEYVKLALARGLSVDQFAPRLSFFFGIGMNFFLEVAKLRAARQLWAELMNERFAPRDPNSMRLRMHCQTSGVTLTAQRPHNNIVRTTVEAMAAILGGTQSLHTNSFDEALALPTEDAARVARDTQLILREETDLTKVVDPLGGSYLVEDLTQKLAVTVRELIAQIDRSGGMVQAIEAGIPQAQIMRAAAERQSQWDSGRRHVVGVNYHADRDEMTDVEVRFVKNATVLETQLARLRELRARRDPKKVEDDLLRLKAAARDPRANLMRHAVECMRHRATVGEVSLALEEVFGRYRQEATFSVGTYGASMNDDAEFAQLQRRVAQFAELTGRRPRMLVAKLGLDGHDRGAKIVASGFADVGFDVELGPLFQSPLEVARAAVDSDVHVVGISSHAGGHEVLVPELIAALRDLGGGHMRVVCGGIIPQKEHETLLALGVSLIFEPGVPITSAAARVLSLLEERRG